MKLQEFIGSYGDYMINSIIRLFTTTAPDFEVLWLASKDLITINNPYLNTQIFTGVGYPPISLLFYLPLNNFNYMVAQNIFTVTSFACILTCIYLTFKILNLNTKYLLSVVLLTLISFPTKFTLGMGQNNFLALALLLSSFYLYKTKKIIFAGVLLGLAISLKTIFLYFLIFYLIKKQWRILNYSLLVVFISIVLIYFIRNNFDLFIYYFKNILPPLFRFENREIYTNQGLSGFVSRLFSDISTRKIITSFLSIILVTYNAFVIYSKKNINLIFSFTIITLLLIDSLAWQHHFVWLLFPFIALFSHSKNIKERLLITLPFILISLNLPDSLLLSNNVFFGTLILYGINVKYLTANKKVLYFK